MILLGDDTAWCIFHVVMEAFFALSTQEALEFAGMSINFRSGKFGYSICPISAKVMLKFSVNFSMTLLKIGHMGYLRLMHGPGYLST